MDDKENILDKYICQECGLPFILYSYETIDNNKDSEKIYISLFCRNPEHKEIKKYNFEDYYDNIIKNNNKKTCKCSSCNKFIKYDKTPNYCYSCQKIICSDCINNCKIKGHNNIFKYDDLLKNNKCFIHLGNDNIYYCLECKKMMCQICFTNHNQNINYHSINTLKSFYLNNFFKIQEQEKIIKSIKKLENRRNFNEFLMKENKNFNSFNNNINNNEKNLFTNISEQKDIDNIPINVIYHDGNLDKPKFRDNIIKDSRKIQKDTNGTLINTQNLDELKLLLQFIEKNKSKSKFILIVNGWAAQEIVDFIKNNNYRNYFISACIYTKQKQKYILIKDKNSDFIEKIYINVPNIVTFIKSSFFNNSYLYNEKLNINAIINYDTYKDFYNFLHKELSRHYGDETEKVFSDNFLIIKEYIEKEQFPNKKKLINDFNIFSELKNKNYGAIIKNFLNNYYFEKCLFFLLNTKEIDIYKKIGFFAGNLMHCIVEYGKSTKKAVNTPKTFYSGMHLNIIEILEFLKNQKREITFPYFLSMTTKKEFVETKFKEKISDKERKEKSLFLVVFKIEYSYNEEYEPCCFELKDLSQYPEEEEYIVLPFTFYILDNIIIDCNKFISEIDLKIIGKKEILENKIKDSKEIEYDKILNIMKIK